MWYFNESTGYMEYHNNMIGYVNTNNMNNSVLEKLEPAVLAEEVIFNDIAEGLYDAHRANVVIEQDKIERLVAHNIDTSAIIKHLRELDEQDDVLFVKIRDLKWYQDGKKLKTQKDDLLRQARELTGLAGTYKASSIMGVIRQFEDNIRRMYDFPRVKSRDEIKAILRLTKDATKKTFAELLTIINEA